MITLQIKKLGKSFGSNRIFSDLSFEYAGNSLGIAGANGSGKSTFLRCLAGLLAPDRGSVRWMNDADEFLDPKQVRQQMGYAAPYINLYDELSCIENLAFLSRVRSAGYNRGGLKQWLREMELGNRIHHPFGHLSTGQQQRLRLTSALFHQPEILLLDEPGANLDEAGHALIQTVFERSRTSRRLLIVASNNPEELDLCERIFSVEEQTFL